MKKFLTSESVTEGHPDKLCDLISDKILDAYIEKDKNSRVACECLAGKGLIVVAGEITSKADVNIEEIVRNTIKTIGYDNEKIDIDYRTCKVIINLSKQSKDIEKGINKNKELGAGDQGIVFGYATNETKNYLPMPIYLAHKLASKLTEVRKSKKISYLKPDGKVQVTIEYNNDEPTRIQTILISTQHKENVNLEMLRKEIINKVVKQVVEEKLIDNNTQFIINPAGRFVIGGPLGDTGLTGRKIILDTYGGFSKHGGGAFSGKDPTKIDRAGAYMARFLAKNIVANKLAEKCEIQISYGIGLVTPIAVTVDTFGTGAIYDEDIAKIILNKFDLSPVGIINFLKLKRPIYAKTTNYGHFGKQYFSWEKIIKIV